MPKQVDHTARRRAIADGCGVGGSGSFGSSQTGRMVTIVVEGVADGAAVVKFSTT